jgi:hypothetical protein
MTMKTVLIARASIAGPALAAFRNYDVAHRPVELEKQRHLFTGLFVPRTRFGTNVLNGRGVARTPGR